MILHPKQAQSFLRIYKALLQFIFYQEFEAEIDTSDDYRDARDLLFADSSLIDKFTSVADELTGSDEEILENVREGVKDTFVYLKTLKDYSLFMSDSTGTFYCVLGVTNSIKELAPGTFSLIETVLLNFEDVIICDGLISHHNMSIGPNMRRDISAQYKLAKENKELKQHLTSG
ncbi:MAG: hypothetical protein HQ515_24220 [Phycisphaeraceae bacterium]|nr:hypothetical protein [Phycisphaeraceae bacterium]